MQDQPGMRIAPSSDFIANNLLDFCAGVLRETLDDKRRFERLSGLGKLGSRLEWFVRGYERIDDPGISTNDEILNWAFTETPTDLGSAIWLLASGFYKASASSLRNALDIGTASLYFQIRENAHTGPSFNPFFSEWDRGERKTPNWGEMKSVIAAQRSVVEFMSKVQRDPFEDGHRLFKLLCSYTHTSAFTKAGEPITAINVSGTAPAFEPQAFERGCKLVAATMSQIAILWQVTFPSIARTDPLGVDREKYYPLLFPPPIGPFVLHHN